MISRASGALGKELTKLFLQKGNKVIELVEEIPDIDKKSEVLEEEVKSVASQVLGSVIESALDNTAQPK